MDGRYNSLDPILLQALGKYAAHSFHIVHCKKGHAAVHSIPSSMNAPKEPPPYPAAIHFVLSNSA
jgi:hypothetical protein